MYNIILLFLTATVFVQCALLYFGFRYLWALRDRCDRSWGDNVFYKQELERQRARYNALINECCVKINPFAYSSIKDIISKEED